MSRESLHTQLEQPSELERLIERIADRIIERVAQKAPESLFITSKACARLIGVTPQHLCMMRARGEGPPWSGKGKWIRYDRRAVVVWLSNLPDGRETTCQSNPLPPKNNTHPERATANSAAEG